MALLSIVCLNQLMKLPRRVKTIENVIKYNSNIWYRGTMYVRVLNVLWKSNQHIEPKHNKIKTVYKSYIVQVLIVFLVGV